MRRGLSRKRWGGSNGPKNGAHLPWFARCGGCLTLGSKRTRTTVRYPSAIHDAHRAIVLRSALVHGKGMTCRTTQRTIRLWHKICPSKSFGERSASPLGRSILSRFTGKSGGWFLSGFTGRNGGWFLRRFAGRNGGWLLRGCKFGQTHGRGGEMLPQIKTKIPKPLTQNLAKLLSTSGTRIPAIRILFDILVGEHRLK